MGHFAAKKINVSRIGKVKSFDFLASAAFKFVQKYNLLFGEVHK